MESSEEGHHQVDNQQPGSMTTASPGEVQWLCSFSALCRQCILAKPGGFPIHHVGTPAYGDRA